MSHVHRCLALSLLLLAGCDRDRASAADPTAPAGQGGSTASDDETSVSTAIDAYGVDGPEVVDGVGYLAAADVRALFGQGYQLCYDFVLSSFSCESVSRPLTLRRDVVVTEGMYRDNALTKIVLRTRLETKGKYLCTTLSDADIEARTILRSGGELAIDEPGDYAETEAAHADWQARLKRLLADEIGVEVCYRWSATSRDPAGTPIELREYAFIDGIRQPQPEATTASVMLGDLKSLKLRVRD